MLRFESKDLFSALKVFHLLPVDKIEDHLNKVSTGVGLTDVGYFMWMLCKMNVSYNHDL